ncbi:MAG: hypothetical protein A2Z20_10840 [Bdellovibrionales bacterium RBG_16_40_8]|nr:MAG: hypothetical protein A2Z20_10840 [Bdellovibrionales bacterium RBG_16_40_8]
MQILSKVAPREQIKEIRGAIAAGINSRVSNRDLIEARRELRENPFDAEKVIKLKKFELGSNDLTMSAYLEARAQELGRNNL